MDKADACGYERAAEEFIASRTSVGTSTVSRWAITLPKRAEVLDVACGHGEPLTRVLLERGLNVKAIDASPSMVQAFKQRFPDVEIACEPVQTSAFFSRQFDAVLCVGLIFLLAQGEQRNLIITMSKALKLGGSLLLSAPRQKGCWKDALTHRSSLSLGAAQYKRLLEEAGLNYIQSHMDEGGTHYYEAERSEIAH